MDDIREELLRQVTQLSEADIRKKSERICEMIKTFLNKDAVLGFYMAMPHEVQLTSLLRECWKDHVCAVPITYAKGRMDFYVVDKDTRFQKSAYGILEPQNTELLTEKIDVMLIPMVGFDEQLHRLGHGAGYYDRYLAQADCKKIGIAFACQRCDQIYSKPHDIDMDIIITETCIYKKGVSKLVRGLEEKESN